MATAILSAFTGRQVRGDIAMTGEISLRGKVLPIGGLKEKSLAARRVGITTVIIPKANEKDLEKFPETLKKDVTFVAVENVEEVFALSLYQDERVDKNEPRKKVQAKPLPIVPQNTIRRL